MDPSASSPGPARGTLAVLLTAVLLTALAGTPLRAQEVEEADDVPEVRTVDACTACHLGLDEERLAEPARAFRNDIHADRGFTCVDCHGGQGPDGQVRRNPSSGFLAAPDRQSIPSLCGRCHSDARFMRDYNPTVRVDQVQEYVESTHGRLLMEENDPDVATCVNCHPAHNIRPPSDSESSVHPLNVADLCGSCHADQALMEARGHSADELEAYRSSVHAELLYDEGDLSAPTCNDCHGNHGAVPPGVGSVGLVCGQCHSVMAELFTGSGHLDYFAQNGLPGCATCHGNHAIVRPTDADLIRVAGTVCTDCHAARSPEQRVFPTVDQLLDSLARKADHSRELLEEANNVGMEVSQALFELDEVGTAVTKARNAIHGFTVTAVEEEAAAGFQIAETAEERGIEALEEHRFRRIGLAVSAGIILLLILALGLRLREMEHRLGALMEALEGFFDRMIGEDGDPDDEALRLAACALLLEIAHADDVFTADERSHIERLVSTRFDLDSAQAKRLVELAEQERRSGAGLRRFTDLINQRLDREAKMRLVESMWGLVYADGMLADHERDLMRRLSSLLGLSPNDVEASNSAAGKVTDA